MGRKCALIPAAGVGKRLGIPGTKALAPLLGKPLLRWVLEACRATPALDEIVLIVHADDAEAVRIWLAQPPLSSGSGESKTERVVVGGEARPESVARGLRELDPGTELVLVHDGARPLVSPALMERCLEAARAHGAAVAALPLSDSVKWSDDGVWAERSLDRGRLWAAQTPQAFRYPILLEAHRKAADEGYAATDDAGLVERAGFPVFLVPGERTNLKITHPEDLVMAACLAGGEPPSPGFGYDAHRLVAGRPLVLGGVTVPFPMGLLGHSDADVLTHAVCDAVLGALGAGDIGVHFPDTDPAYKGISSLILLKRVGEMAAAAGRQVVHVDAVVVAQAPRLAEHLPAMRANLAATLGAPVERVSVKATTTEGLGFAGRGEGLESYAVCALTGRNYCRQGE